MITKYRELNLNTGIETVHEFEGILKTLSTSRKLAIVDTWNKLSGMDKKYWLEAE